MVKWTNSRSEMVSFFSIQLANPVPRTVAVQILLPPSLPAPATKQFRMLNDDGQPPPFLAIPPSLPSTCDRLRAPPRETPVPAA